MELEKLWQQLFSENAPQIREAWDSLSVEEQAAVRAHLADIAADPERVAAQRTAARFALTVIAPPVGLPDGALAFARELAAETGQRLLSLAGRRTASTKADGTLVTPSDMESDARLRAAILARYPSHGVLSEETARVYRGEAWCWVVDPIDGTTNFDHGLPIWGVLLALLHNGYPVLGVADFPALGEQYWAAAGQGAWLNEARIHAAALPRAADGGPRIAPTDLFACCTRTLKHGAPRVPMKLRVPGCTGYDLALVARGACLGSLDLSVRAWDVAAVWPLLRESGATAAVAPRPGIFPLQTGVDYGPLAISVLSACSDEVHALLQQMVSDRFPARATPAQG